MGPKTEQILEDYATAIDRITADEILGRGVSVVARDEDVEVRPVRGSIDGDDRAGQQLAFGILELARCARGSRARRRGLLPWACAGTIASALAHRGVRRFGHAWPPRRTHRTHVVVPP